MDLCKGKQIYSSENKAKKVREAIYRKRSTKLRVYQCNVCWGWHLTSEDKYEKP
jgi:hypothetical protein